MIIIKKSSMPVDFVDVVKLVIGISVITIPGYLWSYLFSQRITRLERVVFGFLLGMVLLSGAPYIMNVFFVIPLSRSVLLIIFLLYSLPAVVLFCYLWYKSGKHKLQISLFLTRKNLLLLGLLGFTVFMTFLPHLSMNYYLPFHVDEWIHWSYSRAIMDYGSVSFPNPYTGGQFLGNPEIGFHTLTASLSWLTTSTFSTLFLCMPSVFAVFLGLTAFAIGERADKKFGLEACLLISLIPTTTRYLGPSFYVAVAVGLLLLLFLLWLLQQKHYRFTLLIAPVIWCLVLIHPATAFAGIIIATIYSIMFFVEKNIKIAVITGLNIALTCLPFIILLIIPSRWTYAIDIFLNALTGEQYVLRLPAIYVNFSDLGVITWVLFIIGIYYVVIRGKSLQFTLCVSSVAFITIIGLFSVLGVGIPIMYERSFLYLFVFVPLVAAIGLREVRDAIPTFLNTYVPRQITRYDKHLKHTIIPLVIIILLLITAVPTHLNTPYYKMISEKDYESFTWIRNNINSYRDANHTYTTAAVHPYKASPFSAITGLYIVTSSMHPLLRYSLHNDMESFLADRGRNTTFLNKYRITVVYGSCDNSNLTMIYPHVYLYPHPTPI